MSDKKNDGGSVYPVKITLRSDKGYPQPPEYTPGMSLRDHFAGLAMPIVAPAHAPAHSDGSIVHPDKYMSLAFDAYKMADAMIKAREHE